MSSDAGHNSTAAMYDDDQEDDGISSQPLMPYVGMEFDSVDDAKTFYNEYICIQDGLWHTHLRF